MAISFSSVKLACCTRGVTKLGANAETSLVTPCVNPAGRAAGLGVERTTHQRVGITGENLVVVIIGVVEKDLESVMPLSVWMTEL